MGFYLQPPLSSREEALISQSRSEREKGKVRLLFAPFVCLLVCLSPRQALREAPGRVLSCCLPHPRGTLWSPGCVSEQVKHKGHDSSSRNPSGPNRFWRIFQRPQC